MPDYQQMYRILLDAAERALSQLEQGKPQTASEILIEAERRAEEIYLQTSP
ncbi:MAG: hypothetical protein IKM36_06735 [Oscillospiraceae bacterium]|nr:hypothetical protein [Oscillospiraceae bacterium]MBR2896646.1 hypothetical protein [Oscillospiraceae bacterium]MBR2977821.1 hypothetical protein [Oscillospiraceae bacterium]MBR3850166.1 hypothetical protein [Oscillospiraceae bacterium]